MSEELTTTQVADRLETPERTVRLWCKQGRFTGARNVDTPRGNYWLIPESSLKSFEKPQAGRPPKPKTSGADGQVNVKPSKRGSKK
jgi:hypothetical protein